MSTPNPPARPTDAHTRPPPNTFSIDEEQPNNDFHGKISLTTMKGVREEWYHGSRRRVIKYYAVSSLIGLLIGAVIGIAIGVSVRYTVGKD